MLDNFESIPRLSAKEALILQMLIASGEMYGLQMVEESEGNLKRGTVYVTLNRMEDKGYLSSRQEDRRSEAIGLPRRLYRPKAHGVRVYGAWERLATELIPGFVK